MIAPCRDDRSDRLSEDQQALVVEHIDFALRIARRQTAHTKWLREDAESVALETLCGEILRYDPSRGLPFRGFVARRIAGAVQDLIRATSLVGKLRSGVYRPQTYPLGAIVCIDEEGIPLTYEDLIQSSYPSPQARVESDDSFESLLSYLTDRPHCHELFRLVYTQGMTIMEAARKIGVTRRSPWRLHAKGLAKLRRVLGRSGRLCR